MVAFSRISIHKCQLWAVVFFVFASITKSAIINYDFIVRIKRQALNAKLLDSSTPNHIENSHLFEIVSTNMIPQSKHTSDSTLLPDNSPQSNDKVTQTTMPYSSQSFNSLPSEIDFDRSTLGQVNPLIPSTTSGYVHLRNTDTSNKTKVNFSKDIENLSTAKGFLQPSTSLNSLQIDFNTFSPNSNISFVSNTNIPEVTKSTLAPDYIVSPQSRTMYSNLSSHFVENGTSDDNIDLNTPQGIISKTGSFYLHVTPTLAEDFSTPGGLTNNQIDVSDVSFSSSTPNVDKLIDSVSTGHFSSSKYISTHVSQDNPNSFYTSQHVSPSSDENRAHDSLASTNSDSSTVINSDEIFTVATAAAKNTGYSLSSDSTIFDKTYTDNSIILSSTGPNPNRVISEEINLSILNTQLPQSSLYESSSYLSESSSSLSHQNLSLSFKYLKSSLSDLSSTRTSQIANLSDTASYDTLNSETTDSPAAWKTSSFLVRLQSTKLDAASSDMVSNQKSSNQTNHLQTTVESSHFTSTSLYASSKDLSDLQLATSLFNISKERITVSTDQLNLSNTTPHQETSSRSTHIETINILRGQYFTYPLSKSLFRPYININDSLVNLSLYGKIGSNKTEILPKSSWIRINSEERLIYGIALSETLTQTDFVVLARNSRGNQARAYFQVRLKSTSDADTSVVIPHTFTFKLDMNYVRFNMDSDNLIRLMTITASFLGLNLKRNIVVKRVRPGSVLIEWGLFEASSFSSCLRKVVFEKFRLLVELKLKNEYFPNDFEILGGRPSRNFSFFLHPYFNISNITLRTLGPCFIAQETSTFSHVYTTAQLHSMQLGNSLSWILIPLAIVILLSLAFGIICVSLYQKRKHTSRLTFDAIKSVYGANRKPILFLDEMVLDSRQQSSRPRGPLVLANEAYPMSELHVNSFKPGAVMYPEGAFKSHAFEEAPPDYRLPPPYIASPAPSSSNV